MGVEGTNLPAKKVLPRPAPPSGRPFVITTGPYNFDLRGSPETCWSASQSTSTRGNKEQRTDQCNYDKRITPRQRLGMTVDTREKVGNFHLVDVDGRTTRPDQTHRCPALIIQAMYMCETM
jgi:hypothetical protein